MGRPNDVKSKFAALLRARLGQVYSRLPSAAFVAREFNLRARGCEPVSPESVRRWIKGVSMPEEKKLKVLVLWLDLDLSDCFSDGSLGSAGSGNGSVRAGNISDTPEHSENLESYKLAAVIASLSPGDREILKKLAKKLSATQARRLT
jgi:hypothetical protein